MRSIVRVLLLSVAICFPSAITRGDSFGSGTNIFEIEFVTVGNPGNPADTTGDPSPAGSVPYIYRIGKYEISEQMIEMANALGNLGITKDFRGPNKPATGVSWNAIARFVNWLNTNSGHAPAYKFARQPGETGYDANDDIMLWEMADPGFNPNNLYRNSNAHYFLPSVDEWYKAAFYDPNHGGLDVGGYWDFPIGGDTAPVAVSGGTLPGTAVYGNQQTPADVTNAGGLSPYGTMAQGGNVWEWEETSSDLLNDSILSSHGLRGGMWANVISDLSSSFRTSDIPSETGLNSCGFRVASTAIPEPASIVLAAGLPLLLMRRQLC